MSLAFEQFESEKVAERKAAREKIEVDTITTTKNQIGVQESSPVCWSPNGEELCYVNGTHGITICKRDGSNLYSRAKLLAGHRHSVLSILYHPTKPLLVSCGVEGVFVWDLDTGSCIQKIDESTTKDAHEGEVMCMAWLYDGSILITGGKDSTVKVWMLKDSFTFLETIAGHKSSVKALAVCSSRDYFVSAGRDSTIHIWNSKTLHPDVINKRFTDKGIVCTLLASMDGHYGDISTLSVSSDGSTIFSGARDNTIRAWDFASHQCIREVKDRNSMVSHKGDVTGLFAINNDGFLISFSMDGAMHINQLGSLKTEAKMDGDLALISLEEILKGFTEAEAEQVVVNDDLKCNVPLFKDDGVTYAAMNPAIPLMAVSGSHNCIRVFDLTKNIMSPVLIQEFISHSSCVNALSINEQGLLVSVSDDYIVNVFDPANGNRIISFNTGAAMYSVATNNDLIYTAGKDYVIHCYSINRPRFYQSMEQAYALSQQQPPASFYDLYNLVGHSGKIRAIAFSQDLRQIYSGSEDGTVMVHSLPELQPQDAAPSGRPAEDDPEVILDDHTGIVMDVAVSDDVKGCHYLASVGNDYMLNVYAAGKRVSRAWTQDRAHNSVIEAVTFGHGACANLLFTGGWDNLVKVWDCESGELLRELNVHDERITDLCVSKDGRYLVSAAADKTIMLMDIANEYKVMARYQTGDDCKCVAMMEGMIVAGYETGVIRIWPL